MRAGTCNTDFQRRTKVVIPSAVRQAKHCSNWSAAQTARRPLSRHVALCMETWATNSSSSTMTHKSSPSSAHASVRPATSPKQTTSPTSTCNMYRACIGVLQSHVRGTFAERAPHPSIESKRQTSPTLWFWIGMGMAREQSLHKLTRALRPKMVM